METVKNILQSVYIRYVLTGLVALALFAASFYGLQALVTSWCLTQLPGVATSGCGGKTAPEFAQAEPTKPGEETAPTSSETPQAAAPVAALPPAWDGASRVNILVLGVDYADWEADRNGPARSDTMVVLTIDPQSKTAGMLSIPRDMWVSIPGFGYGRINTAYFLGDDKAVPGGGAILASKTVEQFLGVPIHYYAQVEFMTFVYLIDQIGGIDVYIDKKIKIDPIGPGPDDVILPVGLKHLDGMRALAYARQRYGKDGDVDRARRTQKVIMAIRDKVVDPANFPTLVGRAPELYQTAQSGIKTNMSLEDALRLAVLVQQIPADEIKRGVIDNSMVLFDNVVANTGENQSVVKPIPDKIRELRDSIFTTGGPLSPAARGDEVQLAKLEGASILIRNGTYTEGLANKTAEYLKKLGLNIIGTDTSSEFPAVTKVIDHRGKPYAIQYFRNLFSLNSGAQMVFKFDPAAPADIEIILGADWATKNPMP